MNAIVETLLTALALSASASFCLALLPQAPPRLRFAVAAAGLAAWLVPWGALRGMLPPATLPASFAAPLAETLRTAAQLASLPVGPQLDVATLLAYAFSAATLLGVAFFVRDYRALQHCIRRWRAGSRPASQLRLLLPPELAAIRAEFRVVANSDIAAASGYRNGTVWIGDCYCGEQLRLILVHELNHLRARDPLWLLGLTALRRAYWWNPLVAHLARQAVLMLESICDHRSAAHFEKRRYVGELATLVLAGATPAPRMLATARTGNLDVQRLRLLRTTLRVRARDVVVLAAFGAGAAGIAAASIVDLEPEAPEMAAAATVSAPRQARHPQLLDDGYAYTPQQYAGELE